MVVKSSHFGREKAESASVQLLSSLAGYQKFGDFLSIKRKQFGLFQREMAEYLSLTESMYGFLERGRRAPQIEELVPMFAAITQLQADKHLPAMQVIEAETFFRLAKAIIEKKGKKRPDLTPQQWDKIEQQLINLVDHRQHTQVRLVTGEIGASSAVVLEPDDSRRRKALSDMLKTDLSHLLERETWVQRIMIYPDRVPQIKVSVTQAGAGAGKSHALTLLAQRLAQRDDLYLIPYQFKHSETMTPDDHLDEFLATLYTDLTVRVTDETKQRSLAEQIDQVLAAIRTHNQKIIVLVDDAQEIFPAASEWSPSWHQLFEAFIREPHGATLYMMTRTWPGWDDRKRSYIEEEDLPELSLDAAITLWNRQGFDDVDDELLRKVSIRSGQNPQTIEMLAFQFKRRGFSIDWRGSSQRANENPHTISLKKLLASETLFSENLLDQTSRQMLQEVFSSRLSGEDMRLLECLALAPLGIPFDLVVEEFEYAAQTFEALRNASFVDLGMATAGRAAAVPLVREAVLQSLSPQRKQEVECLITKIYARWLQEVQEFNDDAEKAALIAEMVVRYIRSGHLLNAAELFITYGWLCATFGHIGRIKRVYDERVRINRGKEEAPEQEVGRLLLQHRIAVQSGEKIERDERDQIYQSIYRMIIIGEVALQPHSELEVLHNMLLFYNRKGELTSASSMFDETLERLQLSGQMTSEVHALFLFDLGRLMSYRADKENQQELSLQFTRKSADCVKECIAHWRLCLKNALPLQELYVHFKLARALNDLACDLRTMKQYPDAQKAIEESVQLKKQTGTPPHSVAIALSEHSQILAAQGKIREALSVSEDAKKMLEQSIADGDTTHSPELGLVLKERASIFLLQARLADAKTLLEQSVELIGNKPLRLKDKEDAKAQIEKIQLITSSSQLYQLDQRWFSRFVDLIGYDDIDMLAQAGPFSDEETAEWKYLCSQEETEEIHTRMMELIGQSRKREFARSLEKLCPPIIHYPRISLTHVQDRISGLTSLGREIEDQEANAIVRRLYLDAIAEHITFLRLCEAIVLKDQDTVMQCNLKLYGKPSEREFKVALQQLCMMLLEARTHQQASFVAQEVWDHLRSWGISPHEILDENLYFPQLEEISQQKDQKLLANDKKTFPTSIISKFFLDVLALYGEKDWDVSVSHARDNTAVDPDVRVLVLPQKSFSVRKVRQLLAEEIEVHTYRAIAGRNSSLALLGSGLANHLATDEGLAYYYAQRVNSQLYGEYEEKRWNGTLTTGLASGVLTHALSFQELRLFLEKMFLVSELLSGVDWDEAVSESRQMAWRRCCRTFRGVPHLDQAGCCCSKDRVYLQGYLEVSNYLSRGGMEQRLYVGCVGVDHLEDMAELDILAPNYPHQYLALESDLAERLASYKERI